MVEDRSRRGEEVIGLILLQPVDHQKGYDLQEATNVYGMGLSLTSQK